MKSSRHHWTAKNWSLCAHLAMRRRTVHMLQLTNVIPLPNHGRALRLDEYQDQAPERPHVMQSTLAVHVAVQCLPG